MRRFFLTLTFVTLSAWPQSPQQQAQPPIVVQVQMPPANRWIRLLEVVVPGVIGAGLALLGVWLTNLNNRHITAENHKYEDAKLQRQEQVQLRRDFYFALIKAATDFRARLLQYAGLRLAAKDHPPMAEIDDDLRGNKDAIEQLKLALSSAISVGWIILSVNDFPQIEKLDACALTLMSDFAGVQDKKLPQSYHDFENQLLKVVALAKSDLGYN
jgi:hypothetical protein